MQIKLLTAIIAALLLSSCSAMNKRECQAGEWQEAGYSDARKGLTSSRFSTHAKACAEHSIEPDEMLYTQGYSEGLKDYCQPEVGYSKGRNTNDYRGICPVDLEPAFLNGYIKGLESALYDLDRQYSEARTRLQHTRFRVPDDESAEQVSLRDRLIFDLQQEIRDLRQERSELRTAIALWRERNG